MLLFIPKLGLNQDLIIKKKKNNEHKFVNIIKYVIRSE